MDDATFDRSPRAHPDDESGQPSGDPGGVPLRHARERGDPDHPLAATHSDAQPLESAPGSDSPGCAGASAADAAAPPEARQLDPRQVIEALLFASDTPLSLAKLAELSGVGDANEVRLHIAELNARYEQVGASFRIEPIARGYQMLTLPQFHEHLARLHQDRAQCRLSAAALETLAVIAYKQPVIRSDIESIRGVACGDVLNRLREMGLIRVVGRAEVIGRPLLYGTTRRFLDLFGLADLKDLPPMESLMLRPRPGEPTVLTLPTQACDSPPPRAAAGA